MGSSGRPRWTPSAPCPIFPWTLHRLGPRPLARVQVRTPGVPFGEKPSSACTAGLGVGSSFWTLDEFTTTTRMGAKRENPQVRKPACFPPAWAWTGRLREGAERAGPRTPPAAPRLSLAPADMQSSWNSRQPIRKQHRALISMHCAGSHLPPGGGVRLHLDQASGSKDGSGMLIREHLP